MKGVVPDLLERLQQAVTLNTGVIPWSSPVPAFGDPRSSLVATLGLNPSNREFVDEDGRELDGAARRFHTLGSFGLSEWNEVGDRHIDQMVMACDNYFANNPYDGWFRRLDNVIAGTLSSYYGVANRACHLDLVPYATARKWNDLTASQRTDLIKISGRTLGAIVKESTIRVLVLNGRAVVEHLAAISSLGMREQRMPAWVLPRSGGVGVSGYAYWTTTSSLCGVPLGREIALLGYNHNIQSSFGVTSGVINAIRNWIGWFSRRGLP